MVHLKFLDGSNAVLYSIRIFKISS